MLRIHRPAVRLLLIAGALVVVGLGVGLYASKGVWADPPQPCPDVECNSLCWSDGTHPNNGTKVIQKQPTLLECGNNDGTCVTQPCHGH